MGTGASVSAGDAAKGASAEEMQALFDQLSVEDRAKLQGALAEAQGPAEAAAPVEVVAEGAAPAETAAEAATAETEAEAEPAADAAAAAADAGPKETVEAEAAAAEAAAETASPADAKGAPFLTEYFDKVQARTAALIGDQGKLMALAFDPESKTKLSEESKVWFESEAKPLLEKSFKHHDTKNTEVLDKSEAAVFFAHMVQKETHLAKAMSALSIEAGIKASMKMLFTLSAEEREKIKPQLEEKMKKSIAHAQAEVQKKEDNYIANKDTHDAAAFKVLDTNVDGTIQLGEFLAAFEPETKISIELHIALGYLTKEEVEEQEKREESLKEQAKALEGSIEGGCAQQ